MSQENLVFYNGNVPGEFDYTAEHFQGSASHDEKKKQFLNQKIRTFPRVNSFDSSCMPTNTDDRHKTTDGRR